ncbi:alpha/beta hydrolase [Amycolatopsis anabasis]|uniref:alpha/beta hydrolase n=1 Tax=Amycolatopsis anabasis TaxID=1840409 RepID=UPI00131CC632|nr:alpha/beta hydrolase [Amycolatopsis anabasis]
MRTRRRCLLGLAAGALAVTGLVVVPGTAAAQGRGLDWQPCPDAKGVDCATVEVPLDWAKPGGEKIHIGLARRKAKDPDHRIGSILMDPGGPGGSGVDVVKQTEVFTDQVNARFDVVGFDPRGINTSTQLKCDTQLSQDAMNARHPTNQAEFDRLADLNKRLYDSCREHSGALVDHADNLHTVRDLDAVRQALGERKLNYLGYSYGSLMGQQYAEVFPHRIRAMVTDGNMDHSLRSTKDFMFTETEPVEKNFLEFAGWCDRSAECALHGQNTKAVYGDLREKAKAGKLVDPQTKQPIDFYSLSQLAFGVNSPQGWTRLATNLKALKDGNGVLDMTAAADVSENPYPAIWCSDWGFGVKDFAEYARLRGALAKKFPNIQWSPYVDHALSCVGSPVKYTNPRKPLDIDHAPPLVMIGNVHDPATVYRWNRTAAEQSGAHLITYEGWGHTAYHPGRSQCVNDAVDAYLIDLKVPRDGLSCPSLEKPGVVGTQSMEPLTAGPYRA